MQGGRVVLWGRMTGDSCTMVNPNMRRSSSSSDSYRGFKVRVAFGLVIKTSDDSEVGKRKRWHPG